MKEDNKFTYNYTATDESERREIERIRSYYCTEADDGDLKRLRRLDRRVRKYPFTISLILGILGILIFGLGLTMVLEWNLLVWGIIVMLVGCIPMGFSRPLYGLLYKRNNKKYREEILELSERLLKDKDKKES